MGWFGVMPTKNIIIKNKTGEDLKDIYLIYEGLGEHPLKISNISKDGQQTRTLVLNHLIHTTNLTLFYYKNNVKEEIVVCNNLSKEDLRTLTLTISIIEDKFDVKTTFNRI